MLEVALANPGRKLRGEDPDFSAYIMKLAEAEAR